MDLGTIIVLGAVVGAVAILFWDKIKAWASKVYNFITDAINAAIEVVSSALVYIAKGVGKFFKQIKVYIMDRFGKVRLETQKQEISESEIPDDILQELKKKHEVMVMRIKE